MSGPLVRADHVGSLLRPAPITELRAQSVAADQLHAPHLVEPENAAIAHAVARQQAAGLPIVTDGEIRRSFWHYDFLDGLDGFAVTHRADQGGIQFAGHALRPFFPSITGPLGFPADHPMLDHFRYLASITDVTPKISIPGPSTAHFRTPAAEIGPAEYADLEVLFADIARTWSDAVAAFYDAGCRYLQLDDIFFAYLCDEDQRARKRAEGFDPDWLIDAYADVLERAIANRPDDMTIAMHMCRGNFRSTWVAQGGYDRAADAIFNRTSVDVYYMEYDTERAGGLEPLGQLPAGDKRVMAGFVTTKSPELETIDELQKRFDQAASHADLGQLGLAPQCGFASTEEGNVLTENDQWAKLELVVRAAEAIWGSTSS